VRFANLRTNGCFFAKSPITAAFVFSLSGRWEHIPKRTVTPGDLSSLPTLPGNIGFFQAKLTVPMANGMKIPFAFTASNRSELIKEKKSLGAHVGITFDIDSLLAKGK
jgi:hypothetical protein